MSYDGATNTFSIYSEDYALLGVREITVEAHLTDYSSIMTAVPLTTQITVIDPCLDPFTFLAPLQSAPAPYYYTAGSPELVFETVSFDITPTHCGAYTTYACGITAGARTDLCSIVEPNAVGGNSVGAFDSITGRFSFNSIDMIGFVPGTYTLEVTGTSGLKTDSFTVDLVLIDPCPTVDLQL